MYYAQVAYQMMWRNIQDFLRDLVRAGSFASIQVDLATVAPKQSRELGTIYLTTFHGGKFTKVLIGLKPCFEEIIDAPALQRWYKGAMDRLAVDQLLPRIATFTCGSGANILRVLRQLADESSPTNEPVFTCLAHALNNAVSRAVDQSRCRFADDFRKVATALHNSNSKTRLFANNQAAVAGDADMGDPESVKILKLLSCIATRWVGMLVALSRAWVMRPEMEAFFKEGAAQVPQWDQVGEFLAVLSLAGRTTCKLQRTGGSSLAAGVVELIFLYERFGGNDKVSYDTPYDEKLRFLKPINHVNLPRVTVGTSSITEDGDKVVVCPFGYYTNLATVDNKLASAQVKQFVVALREELRVRMFCVNGALNGAPQRRLDELHILYDVAEDERARLACIALGSHPLTSGLHKLGAFRGLDKDRLEAAIVEAFVLEIKELHKFRARNRGEREVDRSVAGEAGGLDGEAGLAARPEEERAGPAMAFSALSNFAGLLQQLHKQQPEAADDYRIRKSVEGMLVKVRSFGLGDGPFEAQTALIQALPALESPT